MNNLIKLNIPSNLKYLETVIDVVEYFLKNNIKNDEIINSEVASITEATSNAIIHGNNENSEKNIYLKISITNSDIITTIEDSNKKYHNYYNNYEYGEEDVLSQHGRGLFIIDTYMDEVSFEKGKKGNILKMIKRLNNE